jgi:hypothetical protein
MTNYTPLAALLLVALPTISLAQTPDDAVSVDPVVHNVILENEFIRVFDARAAKGTKSPLHTHPPMVLVSLGKARLRMTQPDGKTTSFDLNPGQAMWVEDARHSWELVAGELHAIGIEVKSARDGRIPPAPVRKPNDAVAVDPEAHRVLFENPHVRVFEGRTSAGRRSSMHSHPPSLYVSLDWMRVKLTLPDGKTAIGDFSPAQVYWFENGAEHSWEALAGAGRVIAVEVKAAAAPAGT